MTKSDALVVEMVRLRIIDKLVGIDETLFQLLFQLLEPELSILAMLEKEVTQ